MRRALLTALAGAALTLGLVALADATQNRPDPPRPGTATELELEVRAKGKSAPAAARALVGACRMTVGHSVGEPVETAEGRFLVRLEPGLGEHAGRRFLGCLTDATVDRVTATVVDRRDLA